MVGFLGFMAAGAAIGARDASNASVRAQNELEIGNSREQLREQFANRRFDKEVELSRESAKAKSQQDTIRYQRTMDDKKDQRAHEIEKTGLLNKGRMDAANVREDGANSRNNQRISAAEKLAQTKSTGGSSNENNMVTLKDGTKFLPSTPLEKDALTIMRINPGMSFEDAVITAKTGALISTAAGDPRAIFSDSGIPGKANELARQTYGGGGIKPQEQAARKLNPSTGRFE